MEDTFILIGMKLKDFIKPKEEIAFREAFDDGSFDDLLDEKYGNYIKQSSAILAGIRHDLLIKLGCQKVNLSKKEQNKVVFGDHPFYETPKGVFPFSFFGLELMYSGGDIEDDFDDIDIGVIVKGRYIRTLLDWNSDEQGTVDKIDLKLLEKIKNKIAKKLPELKKCEVISHVVSL